MSVPTTAASSCSPTKPQRSRSAYNYFFQEIKTKVQDEVFEQTGRKPSYTVLARRIAARWKQVSPSEKAVYQAMAVKDKRRYALESIAWKMQNKAAGECERPEKIPSEILLTNKTKLVERDSVSPTSSMPVLSCFSVLSSLKPSSYTISSYFDGREESSGIRALSETEMGAKQDCPAIQALQVVKEDEGTVEPHSESHGKGVLFDDSELWFLADFGIQGYDLYSQEMRKLFL